MKTNLSNIAGMLFVVGIFLLVSACSRKANVAEQAQEAYAQGMEYYNVGGEQNLRQAIEYFTQSTEIDSNFARGYAGLSLAYTSIGGNYNIIAPEESWPKAREAVEKALALDPELSEGHFALALVKEGFHWDWPEAEKEYKRALELDPNNMTALIGYARFLDQLDRRGEALTMLEKVQKIAPDLWGVKAYMHVLNGEIEKAKQFFTEAIDADPENPYLHWRMAMRLAREGSYAEAEKHLLIQIPLMNGDVVDEVALLGHIYGRMGRNEEALEQLAKLGALSDRGRYVSPVLQAWIYTGLNEKEEAFASLLEGYELHAHRMGLGLNDFIFIYEPIADDPRFTDLLKKLNLQGPPFI